MICRAGHQIELKAGQILFRPGDPCVNFPFLLRGRVRVQRITQTGKEIILYRIGEGEMCVLSTAGLLASKEYAAEGVVETPGRAILLPDSRFHHLLATSNDFREFVFNGFAARMLALMDRMEDVLDVKLEARLAGLLMQKSAKTSSIAMTHKELALELATSREVVTRILSRDALEGYIAGARGQVTIVQPAALNGIAHSNRFA